MKRKLIRLATLALALVMLLGALPASAASVIKVNDINIMVNNRIFAPTDANGEPVRVFEYNGTTYAPLRALAEAYGLNVGYSEELRCAYVYESVEPDLSGVSASDAAEIVPVETSGKSSLIVKPINIVVNGSIFKPTDVNGAPVAVFETGGTTYAPLRALAEAYGLGVGYNAEKRLAYVTRPGETPAFATLADGSTLIAAEIDPSGEGTESADEVIRENDGWAIPDYKSFARVGVENENNGNSTFRQRVTEYLELLQSEEFGFEIVQDDLGYGIDRWWLNRSDDNMNDDYGDVMVEFYYTSNLTKAEVKIRNDEYHFADMGHRWSGYGYVDTTVVGERAAEAYVLDDGYFRNAGDGLLSVQAGASKQGTHLDDCYGKTYVCGIGQCTMIINGSELVTRDVVVGDYALRTGKKSINDTKDQIIVYDENGDIEVHIAWPRDSLEVGEVYYLDNFNMESADLFDLTTYCSQYSEDTTFTKETAYALTLRPLWLERGSSSDSLIYFYGAFKDDNGVQTSVEGLLAAPFNLVANSEEYVEPEPDPADDPNAIKLKVGERKELEYDKPYVFMPNYETFDWYLKSGEGIVEIISTSSDSCIIEAKAPGTATVTCHYQYGTDEPDVLTGIERNENHSRSHTFTIVVE